MKRFFAILLIVCSLLSLLVPAASAADTLTDLQRAVVETALAYYYKGGTIQYDSYPLSAGNHWRGSILRRTGNRAPEDASVDDIIYTVCSGYPYDVYYNAFGMHLVDEEVWNKISTNPFASVLHGMDLSEEDLLYAYSNASATSTFEAMGETWKETGENPKNMVIAFWGRVGEDGVEDGPASVAEVQNLLEPGDVVVVCTTSGGHAMMFLGDIFGDNKDYVIHSNGDKYADDRGTLNDTTGTALTGGYDWLEATSNQLYSRNGTVRVLPFADILGEDGTYSVLNTSKSVTVLRPLNAVSVEDLTDAAKFRLHHPALTIYKTADVKPYHDVMVDDTITYTVKIENNTRDNVNWYNIGEGSEGFLGFGKTEGWGAVVKETSRNKTYTDLVLTETLPVGTTLVSADGSYDYNENDRTLTWTVPSVEPAGNTTITYKVKVTGGTQVVSPEGKITATGKDGFVGTKELRHEVVSNRVDAAAIGQITDASVTASSSSKRTGLDVAEDVYGALGYELALPETQQLVDMVFTKTAFSEEKQTTNQIKFQLMDAEDLSSQQARALRNMVVPGFVGGKRLYTTNENGAPTSRNRLTTLDQGFLQAGDILLYIQTSGRNGAVSSEKAYVYLGDDRFACYTSGTFDTIDDPVDYYYSSSDSDAKGKLMSNDVGSYNPPDGTRKYSHSDVLHQAFLQDLFVVLRPARVGLEQQTASTTANAVELNHNGTVSNYASLANAYTDAVDGDTITLREDVKNSSVQKIEKNITLDLNGHSIATTSTANDTLRVNTEQAVVKNGTINGVVYVGGTSDLTLENIDLRSPGNTYKISSVTRSGSALCKVSGSKVTLNNVSIASQSTEYLPIQQGNVTAGTTVTYKNITVKGDVKVLIPDGLTFNHESLTLDDGVEVYTGTLKRSYAGNVKFTEGDTYTAITFTASPDVKNETTGVYYASLSQAIKERADGDTLRLLRDIDASEIDEAANNADASYDDSGNVKSFYRVASNTTIIEMDGHSIVEEFSTDYSFYLTGTVTLRNGTILGAPRDAINVAGGNATLENMRIGAQRYALCTRAGNVTVGDGSILVGSFDGKNSDGYALYSKGGTTTLRGRSAVYNVGGQAMNITTAANVVAEEAIMGTGLYDYNMNGVQGESTFSKAQGVDKMNTRQTKVVELAGQTYFFTSDVYSFTDPAVTNGEKNYGTLAAALQDASDGDTVTVKKDMTVAENVTVPAGVTLDLAEHTMTLEENAAMTVAGTVTGGEVDASAEQITLEGSGSYLGITIPEGVTGTVHPDQTLNGEYTMAADTVIKVSGTVDTTHQNVQMMNLDDGSKVSVENGKFSLGNRVAKEMGDTTRVVLIVEGENATYVGKTQEICVQTTAEQVLKGIDWTDAEQAKAGRGLVAMLNYGAQAQTYFGYNVGALANANIGQYNEYLNSNPAHTDSSRLSGSGKELLYGTSCVLGEELQMKMYFKVPADTTDVTAVLTYKGNTYNLSSTNMTKAEDTDAESDYYSYVLVGLELTDLDEAVSVVVKQNGTEVATATETLRSYLARFYALDDKGAPMADAILSYALAVKDLS